MRSRIAFCRSSSCTREKQVLTISFCRSFISHRAMVKAASRYFSWSLRSCSCRYKLETSISKTSGITTKLTTTMVIFLWMGSLSIKFKIV